MLPPKNIVGATLVLVGLTLPASAAPPCPQTDIVRRVLGTESSLADGLWRSAGVEVRVDRTERSLVERVPSWLIDLRVRTGLTRVRSLGGAARVVVGSRASAEAGALARLAGVEFDDLGFSFAGQRFEHSTARFVGCLEDPERPGLPVTVVFGNDSSRMSDGLLYLPVWDSPGAEVWSEGRLEWTAVLNRRGELQGQPRAIAGPLREGVSSLIRFPSRGLEVWSVPPKDPKRLRAYAESAVAAEERVVRWFGPDVGTETTLLVLDDPCLVAKFGSGQRGGSLFAVNHEAQRVYACLAPGLPDDGGAGAAIARAIAIAGLPGRSWMLDALGAAASGALRGRRTREIATGWSSRDAEFNIDELFTRESLRRPPGSRDGVLRALVFEQLAVTVGTHELRHYWRDGVPLHLWRDLAPSMLTRLRGLAESNEPAVERSVAAETFAGALLSTRSFTTEDGATQSGYWVDGLEERFETLRQLGANGVILEFNLSLSQREPLRGGLGAQSDLSLDDALELAFAVRQAQASGLRVGVVLSPIVSASSGWPDHASVSAGNVAHFVEQYWSRLDEMVSQAEWLGVEFLVLGKGLRELAATRRFDTQDEETHRLNDARRAGWTTLIERTRRGFNGGVGYAVRVGAIPNSGSSYEDELRVMDFGAQLDFVMLLCVPRWKKRPQAALKIEGDIRRLIDGALRDAPNQPVFLVGGSPSTSEAWRFGAAVGVADLGWHRLFGQGLSGEFVRSKRARHLVGAAWRYVNADARADGPVDFDPLGSLAERELGELLSGVRRP